MMIEKMSEKEINALRLYLINNPDLLLFTQIFFKHVEKTKFIVKPHHRKICDVLDSILNNTHPTNKVIFNMPPRHGKTEIAMIMFAAYGFAINPSAISTHHSYSDKLITNNAMKVRKIMESTLYKQLFGSIIINRAKNVINTSSGGVFYCAPFLGQIIGFGAGVLGQDRFAGAMMIDDPMKPGEAMSEVVRTSVNEQWELTFQSRFNDPRTPLIVTMQRLHFKDFTDHLIKHFGTIETGGELDIVTFPAILNEGTDKEEALWEERKPLSDLQEMRRVSNWVFETQFQQNPKPVEGLLYDQNKTLLYTSVEPEFRIGFIDPADGGDRTASYIFGYKDGAVFVEDIIYTRDKAEVSIQRILNQIKQYKPTKVYCEAVMTWRLFYNLLKEKVREAHLDTDVVSFQTRKEKEGRIFSTATIVQSNFYFLEMGYRSFEYQKAWVDRHNYVVFVKDQPDDGVEVEHFAAEWFSEKRLLKFNISIDE